MKEEKKKLHIKHIELWIIAFVLVIGVAVFAIVYAITQFSNNYEPGYYEIQAEYKEEVPTYSSDFTFIYYLDGSSSEIGMKKNELQRIYGNYLYQSYVSLDEEKTYTGYPSIARINQSPNEEVAISDKMYQILKDAYQKTSYSENYSIFADPIYGFWYTSFGLFEQADKVARDPINNAASKEYLENVVEVVNNRANVDLLFLEDNKVKLVVSEEYLNLRKELGITSPYVGLNIIKNAYMVSDVMEKLQADGYNKGIIITTDGIVSQASGFKGVNYSFYETSPKTITYIGASSVGVPSSGANFHYFNVNQYKYPLYYEFEQDGVTYYRSLHIDIDTGMPTNNYYCTQVLRNHINPIDATYLNNELAAMNSIEEIKAYLVKHNLQNEKVLIDLTKNDKTIYVSESLYNFVSISKELDYNLIKF